MDINTIKSLIKLISKSNIAEIKIQIESTSIYIRNKTKITKDEEFDKFFCSSNNRYYSKSDISNDIIHKKNQYITIKSPMIGTFYRRPNPNKDPFVKIGDIIKVGMKICVIEAMKIFNDIESEVNGKLIKILVEDSTPVDYDQPLFIVESNH
ncbi:acetyl-CoA carboxylase biotin carboxyl carrier protein [Blattabacterium cuenoti]|uniref:acetyl-CoA carboxylase biotin carboxyl carrier protein n=1 Tax=Blattabacterium cuenoti TaxID=1653831 RepID=UPI00163B7203|nr:acetyl-CoA carboxylase biotin carboxyl carrier protein [Blattabacterium cuenoti]